jgi:hypothetical protein
VLSKDMGLNAVQRVFTGAIVNPFDEVELNIHIDKEQRLFTLFDSLLTNKYFNNIAEAELKMQENPGYKPEIEDIIKHKIDVNSSAFKKRARVEKDAFFTSEKLLFSKFSMIYETLREFKAKNATSEK